MYPDRDFPEACDNLSSYVSLVGAYTGFKRFSRIRDPALKPYHRLRESPDPDLVNFSGGLDGHQLRRKQYEEIVRGILFVVCVRGIFLHGDGR
jgi:hypothetical protein